MKFSETLQELRNISNQLREQGVTVQKLDSAIEEITQHQENIEKIEANIDAIKAEVVEPLENELKQNRVAGRFSIFGFWVGAIALVVAIGSIVYQSFYSAYPATTKLQDPGSGRLVDISKGDAQVLDHLRLITSQLLFPKSMQLTEGEFFASWPDTTKIPGIEGAGDELSIYVDAISDYPDKELVAAIKLYRDGSVIGPRALEGNFRQTDGSTTFRRWINDESMAVRPGDTLKVGQYSLVIKEIFSESALGRLKGDNKSGVVIEVRTVSDG